jgi:uncharacterized CHY-type Zn-finger protein
MTTAWKEEEQDANGVLCGICRIEVSINAYLSSIDSCLSRNLPFTPEFRAQNASCFARTDAFDG